MNRDGWTVVTARQPCPICHKPDWCAVSQTTGATNCMRVPSDRPVANGGWMHGLKNAPKRPPARPALRTTYEPPDFDAASWWAAARAATVQNPQHLETWATALGLPADTIAYLGATTTCDMLAFPMHDGRGNICGIRTRTHEGEKKAITGSKAGVFLPLVGLPAVDVLICEGPTDAAAAMALGFEPIGRPSCIGQEQHVIDTIRRWGSSRATICADSDGPGIAGANRLADAIRASRIAVRMVTPTGHKDLRDWLRHGATRATVDAAWQQAAWR